MLKEKEEGDVNAFYQDEEFDEPMGKKLDDIQRIMNENSRISEDFKSKEERKVI